MRTPSSTEWRGYETSEPGHWTMSAWLVAVPLRSWERAWFYLHPWEDCRVYWGSHGCDLRRGHWRRHRCGGLDRNRCSHGYYAPPWWAPWRSDTTNYFGEDAA